jgi:ribose transport system ATP-binding protein
MSLSPAPAALVGSGDPLVTVRNISKNFGSTVALSNVSLVGNAGSIHAITGENGAGKSTLMKLLAGVHQQDAGELFIAGQQVLLRDPASARAAGISTVFQELTVLPNLTLAENLMLGREPGRFGFLDRAAVLEKASAVLARIGIAIDPKLPCGDLSIGEQQLVEIAKGVSADASVFIFDEPTAPLNRTEVDKLEQLLLALKAQGKLIFYISHRLDEIFRFCDTVTVLKDGHWVCTEPTESLTHDRLIALMVGRSLQALYPPRGVSNGDQIVALNVLELTPVPGGPSARLVLHRGEILGMGGLEGQGQREILRALAGALPPASCDIVRHDREGRAQRFDPRIGLTQVVRQGVGLVPEDRKIEGLYLDLSIGDNIRLGLMRRQGLMTLAPNALGTVESTARQLHLRSRDLVQPVGELSGGNQQKVMIGRWLAAGIDTLLVEQPTRGVDVGAKAEIYGLLRSFVREGGAVLVLSSDLLELIGLCDRILMVRAGQIVGNVPASEASEESLLAMALVDSVDCAQPSMEVAA